MNRRERRVVSKAKSKAIAPNIVDLKTSVITSLRAGDLLGAEMSCRRAIEGAPDDPEPLNLMAQVCCNADQFDHAVEWAIRAIRLDPKPEYLTTLGIALLNAGRCDDAVNAFDKAVQLRPNDAALWSDLGDALIAVGRALDAVLCFRRTLELDPIRASAAFKAGGILRETRQLEDAVAFLDVSNNLQPEHSPTLRLRALALDGLGRHAEALRDNLRADELQPNDPEIGNGIGYDLMKLGRYTESLEWFDRAIEVQPDFAQAIHNKALSLFQLNRFGEAAEAFERLQQIDGKNPEAIWDFALLQMLMGNFEAGWRGREARFDLPSVAPRYPTFGRPRWDGSAPLDGKTIVLYADEGLGDAIQFARYAPMVARLGARVVLVVQKELRSLLSGLDGVAQCLSKSDPVPSFDFHCPISSLPMAFRTRLDSIPAARSYLPAPSPELVSTWDERLGAHDKLRVGVVWSGNPKHCNDLNRSMSLRVMQQLLDLDATFVSLQKDLRENDRETLARTKIVDLTPHLASFVDTAALTSCLDVVVTVDTSVAHLAGGLGRTTWTLLPFTPDYRWLIDREDTPWYPTMRLFRQGAERDWNIVIDRVRDELGKQVSLFGTTLKATPTS
ncbi:tetratricopeptide repeat protein [Bradyrhizobium sp. SRS-191]|uniref:tetratricopeptide repeat protein n=1 Tax=Bradyrhizobium sp. SRS-191 TaxID=2962606 RepID=UPI00211E9C33|nr:tetratricopeptide repeat protein [Bradyrhizobium sp. SRS-191]